MEERPHRWRGPLTWIAARKGRFWVAICLGAAAAYLLAVGPWACLLFYPDVQSSIVPIIEPAGFVFFWPALWLAGNGPDWIAHPYQRYISWWEDRAWRLPRLVETYPGVEPLPGP